MKRTFRKIMSLLLAVTLVFGTVAFGFADVDWSEIDWHAFAIKAKAATTSGTCGDNLTWTLDTGSGVLNISGTGDMYDWSYAEVPWYSVCSSIKTVIIENGVTSIGNNAFRGCSNITNVEISSSVIGIGDYAFKECFFLKSITIGENVTDIGEEAFYLTGYYSDRSNWEDDVLYIGKYLIDAYSNPKLYQIKEGTKTIADYAFSDCGGFTGISIPESVTSIGDYAFENCSGITSITIPESVTSIGRYSFINCYSLMNATISGSITSIRDHTFWSCNKLTNLTIPASVTNIEESAFEHCDSIENIYYTDEYEQWIKVYIDMYNEDLSKAVILYECNSERPYYGGYCGGNLKWRFYTDGELFISGSGAMIDWDSDWKYPTYAPWNKYCSDIKTVTISENITHIGDDAFYNCSNITDVYYNGSERDWDLVEIGDNNDYLEEAMIHFEKNIDESVFYTYDPETSELVIKKNISLSDLPSEIRESVKSIVIEDSITTLESYMFSNYPQLESVRLPENITKVENDVIYNCPKLEMICYLGTMKKWYNIPYMEFFTDLTSVMVYECDSQSPYYGQIIDDEHTWTMDMNGELVISGEGMMYDYGEPPYNAPWYCHSEKIKKVTISNGVTTIGDSAFRDCVNLTNVEISNSVTRIGDYAFENCTSLTSIVIPLSVTDIWSNAFKYLTKAYYPGTLSQWENIDIYVGNECLENNIILEYDSLKPYYSKGKCGDNLTWILYDDGELVINGYGVMTLCFPTHWDSHLTQIKTVKIPEGVTVIDYSMFEGCNNITDVYFDGTKEEWEIIKIYDGNTALTSATLHYKGSPIVSPTTNPVGILTTKPVVTDPSTTKPVEVSTTKLVTTESSTTKPAVTELSTNKPVEESTTKPVEIPTMTQPVVTELSTTKPVEVSTTTKPITTELSTTKPVEVPTTAKPVITEPSTTRPVEVPATTKPAEEPSTTEPIDVPSTTKPTEPATKPSQPTTKPTEPTTKPVVTVPTAMAVEIRKPSQTEITYGDSIILHADFEGKIPEGTKVIWATDNANFTIVETTANGSSCVVTPNANGETVFIATLVDADGNAIASDTQTMTSKAGFFRKIIAFFKKIFGLTKIIPEMLK